MEWHPALLNLHPANNCWSATTWTTAVMPTTVHTSESLILPYSLLSPRVLWIRMRGVSQDPSLHQSCSYNRSHFSHGTTSIHHPKTHLYLYPPAAVEVTVYAFKCNHYITGAEHNLPASYILPYSSLTPPSRRYASNSAPTASTNSCPEAETWPLWNVLTWLPGTRVIGAPLAGRQGLTGTHIALTNNYTWSHLISLWWDSINTNLHPTKVSLI